MANIDVFAWSNQGGWADTQTDKDGKYEIYVAAGKWEIVADPGWNSAFAPQPPQRVRVKNNETVTKDFSFSAAGNTVKGVVRDSKGTLVSSMWAWAYARTDNDGFDIITDGPVDSGEFTLKLPVGDYKVGLWIGPESGYTMAAERDADFSQVTEDTTSNVTITVSKNDKTISGKLVDSSGNTVTGVEGDVFAVKGGARGSTWVGTTINEEDGTYSLSLTAGVWDVGYYLELDSDSNYMRSPTKPISVDLSSSSTKTQNITLSTLGGSISGTVKLPNGSAISKEVYVFVNRNAGDNEDPYFDDIQTSSGAFSFKLADGYKYEVGVFLDPNSEYAEPAVIEVDLTSNKTAAGLSLVLGSADSTISGKIVQSDGSAMEEEVYVYAWSTKGQAVEGTSSNDGSYTLKVPSGAIWYVGADYQLIGSDGTPKNFKTAKEVSVDLTNGAQAISDKTLAIFEQSYSLPESIADTFTVSSGYTKVLGDGTQIDIPANAVPVSDTSSKVTINISPVTTGLSSTSTTKPVGYGYSFELLDSSGKAITSNFTKDAIITIAYDSRQVTNEDDIKVSFYSSSKGAWEEAKSVTVDSDNDKIFATVDHFSSWSVTAPQSDEVASNTAPSISAATFTVAENLAVGGAVGTKTGTDPDSDTLAYTITSGNDSGLFAINSTSGAITLAKALNYEAATSHSITVTATDTGSASASASITVAVTDVNDVTPTFSASSYTASIDNNSSVGTSVVDIDATDADVSDSFKSITYSITAGDSDSRFTINSSDGIIKTAKGA